MPKRFLRELMGKPTGWNQLLGPADIWTKKYVSATVWTEGIPTFLLLSSYILRRRGSTEEPRRSNNSSLYSSKKDTRTENSHCCACKGNIISRKNELTLQVFPPMCEYYLEYWKKIQYRNTNSDINLASKIGSFALFWEVLCVGYTLPLYCM